MITEVAFVGGAAGPWRVASLQAVIGAGLPEVPRLRVLENPGPELPLGQWVLRGVTSNQRYTTRAEAAELTGRQEVLGRVEADRAALIPIDKSRAWWALAQDERREIIEERSRHIALGLKQLPAVARRLHHGRDIGAEFDFLPWFEYPASATAGFEELVTELRGTAEWSFVEREVDIRLAR